MIVLLNALGPLLVSLLLIIFAAFDIIHDIQNTNGLQHIVTETVIFFLGFLLNLYFVDKASRAIQGLREQNLKLEIEQQKFREGLTSEIEKQMKKWGLSPSEVEISFLLLKGLSNKEIAEVRSTSESTVRLQCSSIYKKSSLSSRAELAAYFIEDMLAPQEKNLSV